MNKTISAAQAAYIRSHKYHKIRIQLYRVGILLLFLALWETSARMGWIDDFIFSSPSKIALLLYDDRKCIIPSHWHHPV